MVPSDPGRFEQFFNMCPEPSCILGEEGGFEDVNAAWETTLGYPREALSGRPFIDVVHTGDRPRAADAIAALLERRAAREAIELRIVGTNGRAKWALWSAWVPEGQRRIYSILRDLTSARHLEDQLRDEISFNSTLLEASPTFFVAISSDGKTLMMNHGMRSALGYTEEEVLGQDYMTRCVPERDREMLGGVFARLVKDGVSTVNENRVRAKDGRELLVEWHGKPHFNAEGQFEYFLGVGVEIGERRRMEEALRQSEQKLSLHSQETPLGVIEWTPDFRIIDWNVSAARIFGYSREEAVGKNSIGLIITPQQAATAAPMWQGILESKRPIRGRNENITKDGRVIICEWYVTPLIDAVGKVFRVMSLVDDVTEQAVLAAELRRRERAQAETIQRLSTPVIEVWDRILTLPIIGVIDAERAAQMTEELLGAIVRTRAAFTIVDVTGMEGVEPESADHLLKMVRATGLLGSRCLISGISPGAAQTMVNLGLEVRSGLVTFGTLRDALSFALGSARTRPQS